MTTARKDYEERAEAMTVILSGRTFSSEAEANACSVDMIARALREAAAEAFEEAARLVEGTEPLTPDSSRLRWASRIRAFIAPPPPGAEPCRECKGTGAIITASLDGDLADGAYRSPCPYCAPAPRSERLEKAVQDVIRSANRFWDRERMLVSPSDVDPQLRRNWQLELSEARSDMFAALAALAALRAQGDGV